MKTEGLNTVFRQKNLTLLIPWRKISALLGGGWRFRLREGTKAPRVCGRAKRRPRAWGIPLVGMILCLAVEVEAQGMFGKGAPIIPKTVSRPVSLKRQLTAAEIERVKACKELTREVDKKSLQAAVDDLARSDNLEIALLMSESVAKTYADIVRERSVADQEQKEWLYSMVELNMAYLQLGAAYDNSGNALNHVIRRKLLEYLPPGLVNQPEFRYRLDSK